MRCMHCGADASAGVRVCPACQKPLRAIASDASGATPMVLAGRYRILVKVAQRRASTVYKARDEQTGATVAVKRLDTVALVKAADRRQAIEEFRREAKRLALVRHPNLVSVLDYFIDRETCYVVMSWAAGTVLRDLHSQGALSESKIRAIGAQIADALHTLHQLQPPLVFRDLKMSHVVVGDDGKVTLLDLGLPRFFKAGQASGAAERGTAPYEAPEQVGHSFASPQSDIYALGTMILALAMGPQGSESKSTISPHLRQIIAQARQKEANKRFPDASAMRDALQAGVPLPADELAPVVGAVSLAQPKLSLLTKALRVVRQSPKKQLLYRLRIANESGESVRATVKSAVPWLVPRQTELELAPGISQLQVVADPEAIPRQATTVSRAILIDAGNRLWVAAEVIEPEPKLELEEGWLDFGEVGSRAPVLSLHVRNVGGGSLAVRLSAAHEWLHLPLVAFTLAGGQTAEVPVELDLAKAPAGGEYPRAITVDSDYGQAWAGVRFWRGRPVMAVEPRMLDFGAVHGANELPLAVTNTGSGALSFKIRVGSEAIGVTPATAMVPPKHKANLKVTLNQQALPPGALTLDSGVHISSNAGELDIPVRATVQRPLLAVSERSLDFGSLDMDEIAKATLPLVISNRGNQPLSWRIEPFVPWLQVWPSEAKLDSGGNVLVTVSLAAEALGQPGRQEAKPALVVHGDGGAVAIAASLVLVKPLLAVEPSSLDFGMIAEGGVSERQISLRNVGSGVLTWSAHTNATWVEVSPDAGDCGEGRSVTVIVRAYALGLPKGAGEGHAQIEFRGQHNSASVAAAVAVSRPELVVEPQLALGRSVDLAPVAGRLIVFNRGVGELVGTVSPALPWLSVEPMNLSIPSGSSFAVKVVATPPGDSLAGAMRLPQAIAIRTNAGEAEVEVEIELAFEPVIEVIPDRLVLKAGSEGTIIVRNSGRGLFKGSVSSTAPWLTVKPSILTIKPGHRARVGVAVSQEAALERPLQGEAVVSMGELRSRIEVIVA